MFFYLFQMVCKVVFDIKSVTMYIRAYTYQCIKKHNPRKKIFFYKILMCQDGYTFLKIKKSFFLDQSVF